MYSRFLFSFISAVLVLNAQETVNNASVSGQVTGASNGVVINAQVTARQTPPQSATQIAKAGTASPISRSALMRLPCIAKDLPMRHVH